MIFLVTNPKDSPFLIPVDPFSAFDAIDHALLLEILEFLVLFPLWLSSQFPVWFYFLCSRLTCCFQFFACLRIPLSLFYLTHIYCFKCHYKLMVHKAIALRSLRPSNAYKTPPLECIMSNYLTALFTIVSTSTSNSSGKKLICHLPTQHSTNFLLPNISYPHSVLNSQKWSCDVDSGIWWGAGKQLAWRWVAWVWVVRLS